MRFHFRTLRPLYQWPRMTSRSEEHTSELQSLAYLVCRLLLEKKKLAPTLPGHGAGASCTSVERYTDWVRGWLWAQGQHRDLILVGYTLGSCIALQYGLDYPKAVCGLVFMTVALQPKYRDPCGLAIRLRATEEPGIYEQWIAAMRESMRFDALALRDLFFF